MPKDTIYQSVIDEYNRTGSVKRAASNVGTTLVRAQRILITEGLWSSATSENVGALHRQGLTTAQIAEKLVISEKTVQAYLPYTKTEQGYGGDNKSNEAVRSENYRKRMNIAAGSQISAALARKEQSDMKTYLTNTSAVSECADSRGKIEKNMDEAMTVSRLYREHMEKEPEAFRLTLELDLMGLQEEGMEVLRKYGKVENGITRDIIVPAGITLHALNYVILRAFGWQNSHLHQFQLPEEVFQKMTGGENIPDRYGYCVHDGKFTEWMNYCGVYFRYPTEDYEDLYWDDDYTEGVSFRSWLRKKYTGPYRYKGNWEHYNVAQVAALKLRNQIWKDAAKLTIDDMEMGFPGRMNELLERLPLKELLVPQQVAVDENTFEAIRLLAKKQEDEKKELPVIPVAGELVYNYDYGDGWSVKIRMTDCYYTKNRWDTVREENYTGYFVAAVEDKDALKDARVYGMNNQLLGEELALKITTVILKQRPACIAADGLSVMDDVGGIYGYVNFLKTIHEGEPEERESMREWAKWMGWTGRMYKAESVL